MSTSGDDDQTAGGPRLQDPFLQADPWAQGAAAARDPPPEIGEEIPAGYAPPQRVSANMAVTLPSTHEPPAQRIIHDVPPAWDGKDPDNLLEPYLKSLDGWLATTRTLPTQRGLTMLHYAVGDLKFS